jgi:cell pole-organizing protein PopZ
MSEQTAQEPTMEEILASIRRIISEDDAPPAEAQAAPEPVFAPAPVEPEDEDVLELTDAIEASAPLETHGDLDVYEPAAPEPAWTPEPEPAPVFSAPVPEPAPYVPPPSYSAPGEDDDLIGAAAASATASAFGRLEAALSMPAPGRSLDDVVRELLKPLLKQWLDENLPRIAEAKVAEAVEKLQRGRV